MSALSDAVEAFKRADALFEEARMAVEVAELARMAAMKRANEAYLVRSDAENAVLMAAKEHQP